MIRILKTSALLLAFAPMGASAQDLGTGHLELDNVDDAVRASWAAVMVGPYNGLFTAGPVTTALQVFCVDFANGVRVGDDWDVYVTGLQQATALEDRTRLVISGGGAAESLLKYRKAAWLADKFATEPTSDWSAIHAAIWRVMTPGFPDDYFGSTSETNIRNLSQDWMDAVAAAAAGGFAGFDFSEWRILTDQTTSGPGPDDGKQEYLTRITPVPEPGTFVLLLTGLIGLAFVSRRHRLALVS